MNTDSCFKIGKTHIVCQDYAINTKDHIALSDGCSSSPNSDIGARLLCLTNEKHHGITADAKYFLPTVKEITKQLQISEECLNATLFTSDCISYNNKAVFNTMTWGDGVIVFINDNNYVIMSIEYTDNLPLYPIYFCNPECQSILKSLTCNIKIYTSTNKKEQCFIEIDKNHKLCKEALRDLKIYSTINKSIQIFTDNSNYNKIVLFSDGIHSFMQNNEFLHYYDIIPELINFKNTTGEFVKRRANRFMKNCAKNGIEHLDDFSMAAISI